MSQASAYPIPSCAECGIESAARCPTCHRSLCMDHFGCADHQPCETNLAIHSDRRICYICGIPVRPQQWSTTSFSHYIDEGKCRGCGRYICDTLHTRFRSERVELVRDSLRSQRYHIQDRYCDACAPVRTAGGIVGAGRITAVVTVLAATAFIILRHG